MSSVLARGVVEAMGGLDRLNGPRDGKPTIFVFTFEPGPCDLRRPLVRDDPAWRARLRAMLRRKP